MTKIYCLTYRNSDRKLRMAQRFERLGIPATFVRSFARTPAAAIIDAAQPKGRWNPRAWSCAHGHMSMIRQFLETGDEVAVFCEDDVHLHRDFATLLTSAIQAFNEMDHDVMLLGCLSPDRPTGEVLRYIDYNDEQWGTQMYMLRRRYAEYLQNKYDDDYAIRSLTDESMIPFSADWTITKDTRRRSMASPMLAVEEGAIEDTNVSGQARFHRLCHEAHYDPDSYV